MIRSFVRPAACALAAAALTTVLLAVPASTPSQAASFTLSDPNCSGFTWDAASSTLTCTGGGGGGGAVSCSISLSNGSPTVSTAETLTASCSGATGTVSYTWSGGTGAGCMPAVQQGANPNKADVAAPGGNTALNCTYNLSATDSGTNTTSTPSKQVSYTTGGGGGGGGNIDCKSLNGSVSGSTHVITVPWGLAVKVFTADNGGFGPDDAVIFKFTTSDVSTSTNKGNISAVEFSDPPSGRDGALSDTPCDFTVGLSLAGGGRSVFANNNGPFVWFSVNAKKTGAANLNPNQTYYFNVKNSANSTCRQTGSCNMDAVMNKPSGT